MPTCYHCNGTAEDIWDEDGRVIIDRCLHCVEGQVSEEVFFQDQLADVASSLATQYEQEYRHYQDTEGDGYVLCAAENGCSTWEYFKGRVWNRTERILQELEVKPRIEQEVLVTWNEQLKQASQTPIVQETIKQALIPKASTESDDIPF